MSFVNFKRLAIRLEDMLDPGSSAALRQVDADSWLPVANKAGFLLYGPPDGTILGRDGTALMIDKRGSAVYVDRRGHVKRLAKDLNFNVMPDGAYERGGEYFESKGGRLVPAGKPK